MEIMKILIEMLFNFRVGQHHRQNRIYPTKFNGHPIASKLAYVLTCIIKTSRPAIILWGRILDILVFRNEFYTHEQLRHANLVISNMLAMIRAGLQEESVTLASGLP